MSSVHIKALWEQNSDEFLKKSNVYNSTCWNANANWYELKLKD